MTQQSIHRSRTSSDGTVPHSNCNHISSSASFELPHPITTGQPTLEMDDSEWCEQMLLHSLDDKQHHNSFSTAHTGSTSCLSDDDDILDSVPLGEVESEMDIDPIRVTPEECNSTPGFSLNQQLQHVALNESPPPEEEKPGMPGKFDVLCGQSRVCANHTGNRRFQIVLDLYAPRYDAATSKQEKMAFTKEIVGQITKSGGRFLKYQDGVWQEISTVTARDKVSHALRTKVSSWRRQQKQAEQNSKVQATSSSTPDKKTKSSAASRRRRGHRRLSSGGSEMTTASDIVTSSFDGNDPASNSLVEDLLKTQREIFAGLQRQNEQQAKVHPLKR